MKSRNLTLGLWAFTGALLAAQGESFSERAARTHYPCRIVD